MGDVSSGSLAVLSVLSCAVACCVTLCCAVSCSKLDMLKGWLQELHDVVDHFTVLESRQSVGGADPSASGFPLRPAPPAWQSSLYSTL